MKSITSTLLLCVLIASGVFAQDLQFFQPSYVVDGQTYDQAFLGGLNNPQLSAVDLNNDGIQDLFVFDKSGDRKLTFIADTIAKEYIYSPEYEARFPEMINWVLLRDYDGDGIEDIFTYSVFGLAGVQVFKGYYENDKIAFAPYHFDAPFDIIYYDLQSGGRAQLYVSNIDYPDINDIDCDGDLDILTFSSVGTLIFWFKNISIEEGYGRDSLLYELETTCWGGVYEDGESNAVTLASSPGECAIDFGGHGEGGPRHSGSTLLTFDGDNDGDVELLLGDISFSHLNLLTNGGDCDQAWMNQQDPTFPSYDVSVDVTYYPVSFYTDVTFDGVPDLLVAPNASTDAENKEVLWLYENEGTDSSPSFNYIRDDWLVGEMLDLGEGAHPVFVDYNADGLMDIVVGNVNTFVSLNEFDSRLYLLENVGTSTVPAFELVDDDYLGLSSIDNNFNFCPTFGDMDNDGDMDVIIGDQFGKLHYGENTAGVNQPFDFANLISDYMDISVGFASAPFIVDMNGDGLQDLLIGESKGNINYFQNEGSEDNPYFNSDVNAGANNFFIGNIDTRVPGYSEGYSIPLVLDLIEGRRLITGSLVAGLEVYENIPEDLSGTFESMDDHILTDLKTGRKSHPAFADINGDSLLEMVVGNQSGGLRFYHTNMRQNINVSSHDFVKEDLKISLFPNPATDHVTFSCKGEPLKEDMHIVIYNSLGEKVQQLEFDTRKVNEFVSISNLTPGVYIVDYQVNEVGSVSEKLIVTY